MRPGPTGTACFHALTLLRFFAATPCLRGRLSHGGASYLLCLLNKPVVAKHQGDTSGVILSWYSLPHTDNQTGREGWEATEIQPMSKSCFRLVLHCWKNAAESWRACFYGMELRAERKMNLYWQSEFSSFPSLFVHLMKNSLFFQHVIP